MRSYQPYVAHRHALMKERCLAVLADCAQERKEMRKKLTGYQDYKRIQVLESAFEGLILHMQYSQERKA